VPEAGFEPASPFGRRLLRALSFPVSPLGQARRRVAELRTPKEVATVLALAEEGLNNCEIARLTGIPRGTISDWRLGRRPNFDRAKGTCTVCRGEPSALPQASYTYLLGLYLGDGCLAAHPRGVYKLRVSCASRYPGLIRLCELAMTRVLPNQVGRVEQVGCVEVSSYSKHWVCLFPQHGPGRKHERRIELAGWQQDLVDLDPRPLLRGLLHSDGCRVLNACDALGVEWRPHNRWSLSVARRGSVALLDGFVGPKR
jgi:hypothetical protein